MKSFKEFVFIIIFMFFNPAFALTFDDIKQNNGDEKQIIDIVKKLSKAEKADFLQKHFDSVVNKSEQIDNLITMLYLMPKDSFYDKESLQRFIQNAELFMRIKSAQDFDFIKNRTKSKTFNVYYETILSDTITLKNKNIYVKQYKNYDLFNHKLYNGEFKYSNEKDREIFLNFLTEDIFSIDDNDKDDDTYNKDGKFKEIMTLYFNRPEFKNYKIKSEYHIYKLGYNILEKYSDKTADFIIKKLKNNSTNLENLCYFLDNIIFDVPVDKNLEQDFDSGFYNPKDNPFAEWKQKYIIEASELEGISNPIIKKINECGLNIKTPVRFYIVYVDLVLNPNTTGKEFRENIIKDIEKIAHKRKLSTAQKEEKIEEALKKRYKQVLPKMEEEETINQKHFDELMDKFDATIKNHPELFDF